MNNNFWVVWKKKKIVSCSADKVCAMEDALRNSKYRWTAQTFKNDWEMLVKDGYKIVNCKFVENKQQETINE